MKAANITPEEKEALRYEYCLMIRQKHGIGKEGKDFARRIGKWQARHEKHFAAVVRLVCDVEKQTGDYDFFRESPFPPETVELPAQGTLI